MLQAALAFLTICLTTVSVKFYYFLYMQIGPVKVS